MRWGLGAMEGRIQPVRGSGMCKTAPCGYVVDQRGVASDQRGMASV